MLFPWPGFFEQLSLADVYIYLDDVQFSKGSFTNRVQVEDGDRTRWLTIPLEGGGSFQRIRDLRAKDDGWRASHHELLEQVLADAPNREAALGVLDGAYAETDLAALLINGIERTARYLEIGERRRVLRSGDMGIGGRSWRRVLALVTEVGGTDYITGHGAARYLDHEGFAAAGVTVRYMDYSLGGWPRGSRQATPYQSVLGLIAWTGEAAADHLRPATLRWQDFIARQAHRT